MMTREEAAKWLEETIQDTDTYFSSCSEALQKELDEQKEVFLLALSALRPVSWEQLEKVYRCVHCKDGKSFDGQVVIMGNKGMFLLNFCPSCGAPMTDEAVDIVMRRLEALYEKID